MGKSKRKPYTKMYRGPNYIQEARANRRKAGVQPKQAMRLTQKGWAAYYQYTAALAALERTKNVKSIAARSSDLETVVMCEERLHHEKKWADYCYTFYMENRWTP